MLQAAGFGQRQEQEKFSIFLTEAKAAAVYSTRRMEPGEVFLVCDAGGGTTDLNVLKVISTAKQSLELAPLSWTEGSAVGSALIDYRARRTLIGRLQPIQDKFSEDLETMVTKILDEQFRTFKCSFGVEGMVRLSLSSIMYVWHRVLIQSSSSGIPKDLFAHPRSCSSSRLPAAWNL